VSDLQQPVLYLSCLIDSSLCCTFRVSDTVQQSVLSPEVSGLQQLVLHLDLSVQQLLVLCQEVHGLLQLGLSVYKSMHAAPDVCVNQSFCAAPGVPVYKSLWCAYACPSTGAFVPDRDVFVFNSMFCTCACMSTRTVGCTCVPVLCLWTRACAAPVRVCLHEFRTPPGVHLAQRYMNIGIGNKASQFHFWDT
jgi:hypothetical protein